MRPWRSLLALGVLLLPGCGCEPETLPPSKPAPPPVVPAATALVPMSAGGADLILDSFQGGKPGEPPRGWQAGPGLWTVAEDGTAARGPEVLRQDKATQPWAVILRDGAYAGDLSAEVRFKLVSGEEDASGGILVLAQDTRNYYVCRANALEGNFRLYAVRDNDRVTLESATVTPPALGTWHTLQMGISKGTISCALDGKVLITHARDAAREPAWTSGRVGLWTKADSVTIFDDLSILRLPAAGSGRP